nr:DUF488 family protein [Hyphomicrobium sp.]
MNGCPTSRRHDLRRWYGHDSTRWREFCRRYFGELEGKPEVVDISARLRPERL